jgi:2-oxo-4-hydroxy-4-carboxy-5-ureidoimidazoline decarboxylase
MTISELNNLDRTVFITSIGWIFEQSPWVAERAWQDKPFESILDLHRALIRAVESATVDEQLALIRAHPDLGSRARMTSASTREQAGAGLNTLTPEEFARLQSLNSEYRGRFGFPFLFAVKGSTKYDVLEALEERLKASKDEEFLVALEQVYRIARFRLEEVISESGE